MSVLKSLAVWAVSRGLRLPEASLDRVIELINTHLEEIVEAVLEHGGTLVSYTGDGIMAVFGAPIEQADHGQRAFSAACEIIEVRLPRWNQWLRHR